MVYQKAFEIKMTDEVFLKAQGAWLNQAVQATRGSGKNIKSKFRNFKEFFDWSNEIENIFTQKNNKKSSKKISLAEINALANEYIEKKGG